jgi:hypothetical protein
VPVSSFSLRVAVGVSVGVLVRVGVSLGSTTSDGKTFVVSGERLADTAIPPAKLHIHIPDSINPKISTNRPTSGRRGGSSFIQGLVPPGLNTTGVGIKFFSWCSQSRLFRQK